MLWGKMTTELPHSLNKREKEKGLIKHRISIWMYYIIVG